MSMRSRVSQVLALLFLTACLNTQRRPATSGIDVIGEDQIENMRAVTAYDVVARVHGEYLHSRGRQSLDPKAPVTPAHVFVDDTYYGDISTLKAVPASQLAEVRFYQAYEAQYKFGSGHLGGVVQLITKR